MSFRRSIQHEKRTHKGCQPRGRRRMNAEQSDAGSFQWTSPLNGALPKSLSSVNAMRTPGSARSNKTTSLAPRDPCKATERSGPRFEAPQQSASESLVGKDAHLRWNWECLMLGRYLMVQVSNE